MKCTRREFIKGVATASAGALMSSLITPRRVFAAPTQSKVFEVTNCPIHDDNLRHHGLDTLIDLLSDNGLKLYNTAKWHPWGSASGIIQSNDVVLIKVNCQWKCRGTTNTDLVRGLIHRILSHPDGFAGEIVIFENGQSQGAFDGDPGGWGGYSDWPDIDNNIWINAEQQNLLTVDYLVNTVFKNDPVSSYLLDPIRSTFVAASDHLTHGYRMASDVSYPCITSTGGNRIELKEGIWNGSSHGSNIKLINIPVLKTHGGTGITGALKHTYGILSMVDGYHSIRHYSESGSQCGKMWIDVRNADLNILDCIWVSHEQLRGYPVEATHRSNILLAGTDPVALDYYGSKHVLFPLGGTKAAQHDPDSYSGLINHLTGARDYINTHGGIGGQSTHTGDSNIDVISTEPLPVILGLKPQSTSLSRGGDLTIKAIFKNTKHESQTVYFGTKVTLPNGETRPSSGYLYGPQQIDLLPAELQSIQFFHTIPSHAPLGTYTYHGYIEKSGEGLVETYKFDFTVS